jgi:hypothetical protein
MFDLTYEPIADFGLPAEPGAQTLGAAIEGRWVRAATSNYDGRTFEVRFVGGLAARHRQEAIRWLVDMAPLVGMQLLEAGGRTWTYARGWRQSNDQHPDLYIEQTVLAAATLTFVVEPTGDPIAYVIDEVARPATRSDARHPHWRVYGNGVVLPVNGARPPRAFPTLPVTNPVVSAFAVAGGVRLVTANGDTPMVPCSGRFATRPVVTVNSGQRPPNRSVPAPPTRGRT